MKPSSSNFSAVQSVKNISSNAVLFVINILISLWYTPYLIRNLGSELFGLIPLADSVTNFLGIITLSMNVITGRFLTIELEKGNNSQANQIFNTALFGVLLLISLAIPVAIILIIFVPAIFKLPSDNQPDVQLLFIGTIVAFFLTTLRGNFSVATFAKNRFDLRNIVTFGARVGQIAIIVGLFYYYPPSLVHIGISTLLAGVLAFLGDYFLWRHLLHQLRVSLRAFDWAYLRRLMGSSIWMFLYQVGFIFLMNTDMLVANMTLDLGVAGMFGALLVIPKNLNIMARTVGGVWGPTILSKYSRSDFLGMDRVVSFSVKLIGLTLALPIGLVSGLAKPFLRIWLGPEFEIMTWVLIVLVFHLSVNLISSPFYNIQLTLNRLKVPALVKVFMGMLNFFLAINLARKYGPIGIAIAGALIDTIENLFIWPIFTAKIMNFSWGRYLKKLSPIILTTLSVAIISYSIGLIISPFSLKNLIVIGVLVSGGYIILSFLVGLTKEERVMVLNILREFL